MTDRRGPLSVQETFEPGRGDPRPVALPEPVTASEIMGAHWTVDRQDITGQQKLERQKYGQIAAEIDAHDGVPALQSILMPRHGTPDLIAGNTAYDKDAIWRDVQRIRQTDPGFLDSTPARTAQEFDAWLLKRSKDQRATAQGIIARQSGLGQNALGFGTDIVTDFTDSVNLATLPIGGGGKTILQTMVREALINGLTETAELPSTVQHRAELGEQMSAGDMIADVGTAAIGGALLPGGLHVAGKALGAGGKALGAAGRAIAGSDAGQAVGRAVAPLALRAADLGKASDGEVAAAFSKAVPAEIRTPDQQAALHVLDRQNEIDAINPYVDTPTARDVHADRLQSALAALAQAGDPDGIAPPLAPRTPVSQTVSRETAPLVTGDAAVSTVMARIGQVENASGGGDVRNPRSSATGKYQFTDRTWLNSYKREFGANGLSDAQILAQRADGAMQDRLMRSLTLDNARYLHSIGQPETAGNLYLAHFAGPGGARRILEAEAGTPIERVLSADAIKANPFLHGKTAGDVVAWAHAKMGETPIADRLRLAGDGGDDAVRLAQQELDSANMEATLAARASANADPAAPAIDIAAHAVPYIDPSDEIALKPNSVGGPVLAEAPGPSLDNPNGPAGKAIAESLTHDVKAELPKERSSVTAKGSTYRVHEDGTTSRNKSFHPEHGALDQGPQPRSQATVYVNSADAIKLAEFQAQGGPKVALARTSDGRWGVKYLDGKDAGKFERRTVVSTSPQPAVGLTPVEIWNNGERVHFGNEITELRAETTKSTAPIDPNIAAKDAQRARLKAESPMRAAVDRSALPDSAAEASAAPISTDEHIAGFDRPDDKGATRQIDSLEHDARAMLAADPEATVVLGEGRAGQRLADVLVELDDDASSIEALRRCL